MFKRFKISFSKFPLKKIKNLNWTIIQMIKSNYWRELRVYHLSSIEINLKSNFNNNKREDFTNNRMGRDIVKSPSKILEIMNTKKMIIDSDKKEKGIILGLVPTCN